MGLLAGCGCSFRARRLPKFHAVLAARRRCDSLYSSSGHDDAIAPPSSYSSSSSSSNSSHPPTPPPPLFGCYSSSVQPRSGTSPVHRIDARHLVSFASASDWRTRSPAAVPGLRRRPLRGVRQPKPRPRLAGLSRSRPSREALVAFSRRPDLLDAAFSTGKDASPAMIPEWDTSRPIR